MYVVLIMFIRKAIENLNFVVFLLDNYVTYLLILVYSYKHTFLVSKYSLF